MSLNNLFFKKKYATVQMQKQDKKEENPNTSVPDSLWFKCPGCGNTEYRKQVINNLMCCSKCGYHVRIGAKTRLEYTVDKDTFEEWDKDMISLNPLSFKGYDDKIKALMKKTNLNEAVITGKGKIQGFESVICIMDGNFMMGSMGSVVGEKITRAFEKAIHLKLPVIIFTVSGGARMQEGMYSLMQMAKVSGAVARHSKEGLLYITVFTDPTTGGVTASFGMLGDIILAEKGALIGFAGKRVIEQTIKQALPPNFQRAEFLSKKGFIDKIVSRKELKEVLANILMLHSGEVKVKNNG